MIAPEPTFGQLIWPFLGYNFATVGLFALMPFVLGIDAPSASALIAMMLGGMGAGLSFGKRAGRRMTRQEKVRFSALALVASTVVSGGLLVAVMLLAQASGEQPGALTQLAAIVTAPLFVAILAVVLVAGYGVIYLGLGLGDKNALKAMQKAG